MIVSYCPKPNENVLLVSTVHVEPDIYDAPHKKPMVTYNSQRCSVDIKCFVIILARLRVIAG